MTAAALKSNVYKTRRLDAEAPPPQFVTSRVGLPSLRVGPHALEDVEDPVRGAHMVVTAEQIAGADRVILFGGGLGYRVERLRQLGVTQVIVFEPCKAIWDHAKGQYAARFEGAAVFTDIEPLIAYLSNHTRTRERSMFVVPPPYRRAFPEACERVRRVIAEVQGLTQVRENTVVDRKRLLIENQFANLARLEQVPLATQLGKPLQGRPAFIVSAGPSLDKNAQSLAEASKRGAVFAVNTSAPAVVAAGADIDVLVVIEGLDASDAMKRAISRVRSVALDLSAAVENFEVSARQQLAFMMSASISTELCQSLDAQPLMYGGSVATAAFSLAYVWGADPIVLVGQDLAYTEGRVYASQTPYGAMRAVRRGDIISLEGCPEREAIYRRGGVQEQPRHRPGLRTEAWGGVGEVDVTHDLVLFRHWFEGSAHQIGSQRRLVNATEGGAHINGFEDVRLADVLAELPEQSHGLDRAIEAATRASPDTLTGFRRTVVSHARALARAAENCMRAKPGPKLDQALVRLRQAAKLAPIAEGYAAPALMNLRKETSLTLAARERQTFKAIRDAANEVCRLAS